MDGPVTSSSGDRSSIELAARDLGIVPGDPAYAFVQLMLNRHDQHESDHREHEARLEQILARAEQAASGQIATNAAALFPQSLDNVITRRIVQFNKAAIGICALLLVGMFFSGMRFERSQTPALICNTMAINGRPICFHWNGPPPTDAPAPSSPTGHR